MRNQAWMRWVLLGVAVVLVSGCASAPRRHPQETPVQQLDAAQKVLGAMAGRDVTRTDLERVGKDIQQHEDSRSAVTKIVGAGGPVVIKYSPVTGKHYSGDLEFDPETGARLKVLEE